MLGEKCHQSIWKFFWKIAKKRDYDEEQRKCMIFGLLLVYNHIASNHSNVIFKVLGNVWCCGLYSMHTRYTCNGSIYVSHSIIPDVLIYMLCFTVTVQIQMWHTFFKMIRTTHSKFIQRRTSNWMSLSLSSSSIVHAHYCHWIFDKCLVSEYSALVWYCEFIRK